MKIAAGLLALALSLAACASDGPENGVEVGSEAGTEESSDSSTTASTEAAADDAAANAADADAGDSGEEAPEDDAMEDDTSAAGADDEASEDDAMEDDSTEPADDNTTSADGEPGLLIASLLAQAGLEPTDEILECIEDRGIDLDISPTADEQAVQEATLVLFTCAPDELAAILADETAPPEGATADDVECVIAETFRYLGSLPPAEAMEALETPSMPDQVREEILPIVEDKCGLSAEQANAIFDA